MPLQSSRDSKDWILPAKGLLVDLHDFLPSITLPLVQTYHVTPFPKPHLRFLPSAAFLITMLPLLIV